MTGLQAGQDCFDDLTVTRRTHGAMN